MSCQKKNIKNMRRRQLSVGINFTDGIKITFLKIDTIWREKFQKYNNIKRVFSRMLIWNIIYVKWDVELEMLYFL